MYYLIYGQICEKSWPCHKQKLEIDTKLKMKGDIRFLH